MEPSTTVGREGTHENPEKLENVPGHVVPISTAMSTSSTPNRSASRGDVDETAFIGFRLNRATRVAPARRMIRGKVPFGGEAIRELSDSGLSSREGCGTPCANVTGDPWAAFATTSRSTSRRTRAPTSAASCAIRRRSSCCARSRRRPTAAPTTARSRTSTTSHPRRDRALAALVGVRPRGERGLQRLRRPRRHEGVRGQRSTSSPCPSSSAWSR